MLDLEVMMILLTNGFFIYLLTFSVYFLGSIYGHGHCALYVFAACQLFGIFLKNIL